MLTADFLSVLLTCVFVLGAHQYHYNENVINQQKEW